jgi:hypothetical protein
VIDSITFKVSPFPKTLYDKLQCPLDKKCKVEGYAESLSLSIPQAIIPRQIFFNHVGDR